MPSEGISRTGLGLALQSSWGLFWSQSAVQLVSMCWELAAGTDSSSPCHSQTTGWVLRKAEKLNLKACF